MSWSAERQQEYKREWDARNRERMREYYRAYDAQRKGRDRRDSGRRYSSSHPGVDANRAQRWRKENPAKALAQKAKRASDKAKRTPLWADLKKIEKVYEEAQTMTLLMGEPWHVDHVIPLRGRKVSGLHVHTNLQLLPGIENVKKRNNFEVV